MPLLSSCAQAFHIASGSCVGSFAMRRAMAWEDSRLAATFSLPMPNHWAGVLLRLVRWVITCAEAAIISSQFWPSVLQAIAAFVGSFVFTGLSRNRGLLERLRLRELHRLRSA